MKKMTFKFNKIFLLIFSELDPSQLSFTSKQPPKKKRKSRTAFTNHQIFELEKRFLYQKYLSPADRDEIAAQLGLTNAQVKTKVTKNASKCIRTITLYLWEFIFNPNISNFPSKC